MRDERGLMMMVVPQGGECSKKGGAESFLEIKKALLTSKESSMAVVGGEWVRWGRMGSHVGDVEFFRSIGVEP